jgi:4'-phosphopantetheinyl transferase
VWFASLDASHAVVAKLRALLSADELERAERFHFDRDRERYIVGRGLLRGLLAGYTSCSAEELQFDYSPYGKPALHGDSPISFNVSHSGDRAAFAVGRGVPLGVDIELLDSKPSDVLVARQFFSAGEVDDYLAQPDDVRPRAFLSCWTRKEAYIKARGEGLSLPLQEFDVTLARGAEPRLLRTAWDPDEPSEWLLFDISAGAPGCVAALAVRADRAEVSLGKLVLGATGLQGRAAPSTATGTNVTAHA